VVALALAGATGLTLGGACTLYSNGEGNGADGGPTILPSTDATQLDTAAPPPVDAGDEDVAPPPVDSGKDGAPSTCAPLETNCLDGIDNDCNGLVDCADPACTAGYTCVAPAAGWTGYALYDDTRAAACPSTYPTQADTFEGMIFSPASCGACACTAGGATCGPSNLTCEDDGGACTASMAIASLTASCTALGAGLAADGTTMCAASAPTATAGSCAASGGAASLSAVSFSKLSRTCTATTGPGGGCTGAQVCVAKPAAGSHGVCVSQPVSGSALCPSGYAHAFVVVPTATSYDDTRACTSCSCGGVSGASCSATATLFGGADCDAGTNALPPPILPADGVCQTVATSPTTFLGGSLQSTVTSQGSCAADGGAATGTVTPVSQTAYCCQN
jgi:hypothetical protein